jgi:hypothetical protein
VHAALALDGQAGAYKERGLLVCGKIQEKFFSGDMKICHHKGSLYENNPLQSSRFVCVCFHCNRGEANFSLGTCPLKMGEEGFGEEYSFGGGRVERSQ